MLIVFEGVDGSGKTTQANLLFFSNIWNKFPNVYLTREPTETFWGRMVRAVDSDCSDGEELAKWFTYDRYEHVESVIKPELARGGVVICDRYYFSTMAYQGARGADPAEIQVENEKFAPKPNLLFFLDIGVEDAYARVVGRDGGSSESLPYLCEVRAIYDQMDYPYLHRVDANRETDLVHADILAIIQGYLG